MKLHKPVRAVLLDVDGTLYKQNALRVCMALELLTLPILRCSYRSASDVWKSLRTFRRVREELRQIGCSLEPLSELEIMGTAKRLNVAPGQIAECVAEWILRRPLKYIRLCRQPGLKTFCDFLKSQNIAIGLFSDYPAGEKLHALRLSDCKIWPILCATDSEINAFKPHPKGFLRACEMWGLAPDEVLYVGDRFDVDAMGAAAAGMPCAILSRKRSGHINEKPGNCFVISSFSELQNVLTDSIGR